MIVTLTNHRSNESLSDLPAFFVMGTGTSMGMGMDMDMHVH